MEDFPRLNFTSTLSYSDCLYCVGGVKDGNPVNKVFSISLSGENKEFFVTHYPDLPDRLINPDIAIVSDYLYVFGGRKCIENRNFSNRLFRLRLRGDKNMKWEELPASPCVPGENSFIVQQCNGKNDQLYLFGVVASMASMNPSFYRFDLQTLEWHELKDLLPCPLKPNGFKIGPNHIEVFPLDSDSLFYLYHTITKTWVKGNTPIASDNLITVSNDKTKIMVLEKVRDQFILWIGVPGYSSKHLKSWDYIVLVVYFVVLVLIGWFFAKREKSTSDYFRGGKRVPWFAAGISIIATKISAISFIAYPTKSFSTDLLYFLIPGCYLLAIWIIPKYFIPVLSRLDVTSIYEYLGKRFNSFVRTMGSITFALYEVIRMGVLFLVPAILMSIVSGTNIYMAILIMGLIATLYTYTGGLEAVIWSDVLQTFVMVGGAILTIVFIFYKVDGSALEILKNMENQGKLRVVDTSFNLEDATIFVFFLSSIGGLKDYVANQTVAQRFIATKNEKEAGKSIMLSGLGGVFVICLFLFMGTALFIYYQSFPEKLVPTMDRADALFPWFIIKELPVGVSGLLVAAAFSAAMSSLDSTINSASSLFITDIYKQFISNNEHKAFRLGKNLVLVFGLFGTSVALVLASFPIKCLIDQFFAFMGLLGGGLGGLFMLGLFTKRANSGGAIVGFVTSCFAQYFIQKYTEINVFAYVFTGMAVCFITGYLASYFFPGQKQEVIRE